LQIVVLEDTAGRRAVGKTYGVLGKDKSNVRKTAPPICRRGRDVQERVLIPGHRALPSGGGGHGPSRKSSGFRVTTPSTPACTPPAAMYSSSKSASFGASRASDRADHPIRAGSTTVDRYSKRGRGSTSQVAVDTDQHVAIAVGVTMPSMPPARREPESDWPPRNAHGSARWRRSRCSCRTGGARAIRRAFRWRP
jgi:hypothetical protein